MRIVGDYSDASPSYTVFLSAANSLDLTLSGEASNFNSGAPAMDSGLRNLHFSAQSSAGSFLVDQVVLKNMEDVIPGDVNGDGYVDIFDVNLVSAHWGESGPTADANGDGIVDIFDVNLISANWSPAGGAAVAEPGSGLLLCLGLLALGAIRARSRR
jgi:hypothetical protein